MKINGDPPPPAPIKREELLDCLCSHLSPPDLSKMFTVLFLMCCTKMVLLFLWQYRSSNVHANKSPLNSNKLKNNAWLQQATTHHHLM